MDRLYSQMWTDFILTLQAAIRTVISFAGGSPTAMRNVLYTIIIALFWFGFNYFVEDIASSLGGVGAGQYGGQ